MIRFDTSHGGYPGDVVVQDEYLACPECGASYPLDSMADDEPCDYCAAPLIVARAHPAPESTLRLL